LEIIISYSWQRERERERERERGTGGSKRGEMCSVGIVRREERGKR